MAHIIIITNSFEPIQSRSIHQIEAGMSIFSLLEDTDISQSQWGHSVDIFLNGKSLSTDEYGYIITQGDVLGMVAYPQGGGGGGSNPLRTVLSVAVMVASFAFGPALGAAMGISPTAGMGLGLAQGALASAIGGAVISLAGGALVNMLVPAPSAAAMGGSSSLPSPSPTYNIQYQGNSARLGQVIPCQYGRHRIFPDLIISKAWSEYIDNEQFLYAPLCLGVGEYDIEKIRIADTDISNFSEINYKIYKPNQQVDYFDINVITRDEVIGQTLHGTNEDEHGYVGPFIANPVATQAHKIGIDMVCPYGLYYANDNGGMDNRTVSWQVEARQIDDDDESIGGWIILGSHSLTNNKNSAIRKSYAYTLKTQGRYEVRVKRTNSNDTSSRAGDELNWASLKAFVDGPTKFADISLLLVKMQASDNLSAETSRQINLVQTRKLPIWDGGSWSKLTPTHSIIWAICDIAKASYGAGLEDSRLNLDDLPVLDRLLSDRNDTFNGVFDVKVTVWDALTKVARCGRSVPILQGGQLRIMRDSKQALPVALFSPRNIIKGSFKLEYIMPCDDTADCVTTQYFNEKTWKPAEVTTSLEDSTQDNPAIIQMFGVTNKAHARREGMYIAAANRYRRRLVTFMTELEGMIPTYGDLIAISHDLPCWGQSGEIIEWDQSTNTALLSEPLQWQENSQHYIALRKQDGSLAGPYQCRQGNMEDEVIIEDKLDLMPYIGGNQERTHFSFGGGDAYTMLARILTIRPRSSGEKIQITAVIEDERVHVN